ncbi:ribosome maturation factor RimM [Olivibacter sitiensis]|uniref:ribosome maturation factor RimM n=1 Tax=Olivibacter sitiensis TaxID=376470 RepID=UPI0003FE8358|nr:ribosome maturation factor RimM [Olivibacter sitiensis]
MTSVNDTVKIGYITKTRGLKGELQVYFDHEAYDEIDYELLFIEIDKKLVPFFVEQAQLHKNSTGYFFLEDIDHIDKAQALVKKSIYLQKEKLPVREEGEFYTSDLKGFIVHDQTHGRLGEIIEINEFPQQDVATVNYNNRELLFPIIDDFIIEINEEDRILEVQLPEGLVEMYKG